MPSESAVESTPDLAAKALEALAARVEVFHTAVTTAKEEVRSYVTHQRGMGEFKGEQALMELGPFAIGRIDPERFAMLMGDAEQFSDDALSVLDRADEILANFAAGTDLHVISVERGGDLRDTVKDALNYVGQVFGASRAIELACAGVFDPEQHNHFLSSLPFRSWNRAERRLAPPLVVDVRGEDCLPAGLGEFLDGTVSIVLAVTGPTTPAPLVRLIAPGTFVVQTANPAELERMAASPHPGVALLFDEERPEQARFVHDPDAGAATWSRLTVTHMPEKPDAVGRGRRAPTWIEELDHLGALAKSPSGATEAVSGEAKEAETSPIETVPADQLAAWLLSQTDLENL